MDLGRCKFCDSVNIVRKGIKKAKKGDLQMFSCKDCKRRFVQNLGFERKQATPEQITTVVDLVFGGLSTRKVTCSLEMTGLKITHVTVFNWAAEYGRHMEWYLDKMTPQVSEQWTMLQPRPCLQDVRSPVRPVAGHPCNTASRITKMQQTPLSYRVIQRGSDPKYMGRRQPMSLAPDPWDRAQMKHLDNTLASEPDSINANYDKGIVLLGLCRSDEALACFEKVLGREPSHTKSWVGKGRALTMEEDYDGAKKCFDKVPNSDAVYRDAQHWSDINDRYRARCGRGQANTPETADEENLNDSLESWMDRHLGKIQNLEALLSKFKKDRDGPRRKPGHVLHASLVKAFYEDGGQLKIAAVECNDIEPDTDVDIRLDGDIYIQVWCGKTPAEHTLEQNLIHGVSEPMPLDWCEELKPVMKKLRQLPPNTGKGFVLNYVPGIGGLVSPALHGLCSERKCVMEISQSRPHINVYGTSNFEYRDEACQIARVLGRPLKFFLGDWNEIQAQGRDPISESAYGISVLQLPYRELHVMNKDDLLNYAEQELKDPHYGDLVNLSHGELLAHILHQAMLRDSDCQDGKP